MKKCLLVFLLITIAAVYSVQGQTITIDGNLNDWGVTPGSDWIPDISGVEYVVEDYPVSESHNPGIEECDIEAFYALDGYKIGEPNYIYFAIVLSMPPSGVDYSGHRLITGDLALDVDNDGAYEYGIKLTQGEICDEKCTINGDLGDIYEVTEWGLINPSSVSQDNWKWANILSGAKTGESEIRYVETNWEDNGAANYVIEIKVPKSAIGMTGSGTANLVSLVSCTNDVAEIIKFQYEIPEFATIAIPAVLILGMLYFFRRN